MRPAKNILLVEDEPTLQRILGSVLTDVGHRVESVGTAEQALERLRDAGAPDIDMVLSDKNLPSMNGLDLLAQVRVHEPKVHRLVSFVLVTGYPSRDSALSVLAGDGDGYLVKPFRSLTHAVESIQQILDADLHKRRAGAPVARRVAELLSGIPGVKPPAGLAAAVLLDDVTAASRAKRALTSAGVKVEDVARLPEGGSLMLVAGRVEDLQAFAKKHAGAALVLVDAGASFSDIVTLIGCGGGAVIDPSLLPPEGPA